MKPFFIPWDDIYNISFDYNSQSTVLYLNEASKCAITYAEIPNQSVNLHIGHSERKTEIRTVYENCLIQRKKQNKAGVVLRFTYTACRGAYASDRRHWIIDDILADLEENPQSYAT